MRQHYGYLGTARGPLEIDVIGGSGYSYYASVRWDRDEGMNEDGALTRLRERVYWPLETDCKVTCRCNTEDKNRQRDRLC